MKVEEDPIEDALHYVRERTRERCARDLEEALGPDRGSSPILPRLQDLIRKWRRP